MMALQAALSTLQGADGSASFSFNGYSVLAAVNGPLEVQRRDELPEEATIEVHVRPTAGVGAIRERHFETTIHNTLRKVIRIGALPRTLIQITLQVTGTPETDSVARLPQAASNLEILPPLLNAAVLALLTTSIPLDTTVTAALLAVLPDQKITDKPSVKDLQTASSIHVFAYSAQGELLVVESEGEFDIDIWEKAARKALKICQSSLAGSSKKKASTSATGGLDRALQATVEAEAVKGQQWRQGVK